MNLTETEIETLKALEWASSLEEDSLAKYSFETLLYPAIVRAENLERTVVFPLPTELQLDIDTPEGYARFEKTYKIARRLFSFTKGPLVSLSASKKEGHYHITLYLENEVTDLERILLQAVLGSDGNRELFNYFRFKELGNSDCCFFETLVEKEKELGDRYEPEWELSE